MIDRTNTGFRWHGKDREPLDVQCLLSTETHRVVRLTCGGQQVDVYVSPTGRSVRVFKSGQGELKRARKEGDRG